MTPSAFELQGLLEMYREWFDESNNAHNRSLMMSVPMLIEEIRRLRLSTSAAEIPAPCQTYESECEHLARFCEELKLDTSCCYDMRDLLGLIRRRFDDLEAESHQGRQATAPTDARDAISDINEYIRNLMKERDVARSNAKAMQASAYEWEDCANEWMNKASAYRSELDWVRDGIQHFTNDDDRGQVEHLTLAIDRILAEPERGPK